MIQVPHLSAPTKNAVHRQTKCCCCQLTFLTCSLSFNEAPSQVARVVSMVATLTA